MSGRKQHFIPQSLLSGFGIDRGKKTYVVAYTYERGIFAPPTDGIGAERNFYSELDVAGATETLDDRITDYEQQIPALLARLRDVSGNLDPRIVAEFVTHLTVRNDHFRKAASMGGADLLSGLIDAFSDEGGARALLGIDGDQPTPTQAASFAEMWDEHGATIKAPGLSQTQFNEFAFQALKTQFASFHAEMVGPFREIFGGLVSQVPDVAANAQRRALGDSLTPTLRVGRLADFDWEMVETAEPLVLPDCVALGLDAKDGFLPLMFADLERTDAVFMPLSSHRLLVGRLGDSLGIPKNINEIFASCSWDFFVARDRRPQLEGYCGLLRQTTQRFLSGTIDSVIDEALGKGVP